MKQLKTLLFLLLPICFTVSCNEAKNTTANIQLSDASWISTQEPLPEVDSLLYDVHPSPLFRKEVIAQAAIKSATLSITAAGYYQASLNGERIGPNYLDPAWTDFSKRIYYSEYDLTEKLKNGANCLGVSLGNGFYNPLPLKMWGRRNLRVALPLGKPTFIAQLIIKYENGSQTVINTDDSWKYAYGPVQKNNVYLGEIYDAGQEIKDWDNADFQVDTWKEAQVDNGPGGQLQKAFFPAIQITDVKKPVSIQAMDDGKYMVDMGVNFTGVYRILLNGQAGDTITFRFGERIYEDGSLNPMTAVVGQIKRAGVGGPGAPDIAWQEDQFIFGEEIEQWYQPEFTFHTYRYMEISGLEEAPALADIEGLALNSNVEDPNDFTCDIDLLNDIQSATERTFLANLISVQSDCPAREKFGYGGDLNATAESFIYNFDMQDFYRKTIYDWVDAMSDSTFIDTAPYVGLQYCGISWESAFITTQYQLLLYYQDTAIIKELYQMDLEWMEKAARIHPEGLVEKGLSDHESLAPVPVELTGTTHYLQCARMMQLFAKIMNDDTHEKEFAQLAQKLASIVHDQFWGKQVPGPINRQTLFATLLYLDVIPKAEQEQAVDSLMAALVAADNHFITGIFGTKYILEALSKTGHIQEVFDIVNNRTYPGWGHMIDRGATTLWETWKESDNTFSNCHPMFGSVTEWFYRWLAGIRPHPDYPGFEKFILNPFVPNGLNEASAVYESPYGKIVAEWKKEGQSQTFEISIPSKSMAMVTIPASQQQMVSCNDSKGKTFKPQRMPNGDAYFELEGGEYKILLSQ